MMFYIELQISNDLVCSAFVDINFCVDTNIYITIMA